MTENGKMWLADNGEWALGYFFAATPAKARYAAAVLDRDNDANPGPLFDYLPHIRVSRAAALDGHGKNINLLDCDEDLSAVYAAGLVVECGGDDDDLFFPTPKARADWENTEREMREEWD